MVSVFPAFPAFPVVVGARQHLCGFALVLVLVLVLVLALVLRFLASLLFLEGKTQIGD